MPKEPKWPNQKNHAIYSKIPNSGIEPLSYCLLRERIKFWLISQIETIIASEKNGDILPIL